MASFPDNGEFDTGSGGIGGLVRPVEPTDRRVSEHEAR